MGDVKILRAEMVEHTVMAEEMKRLQQLRIDDKIPDTIIMVEHPEVVTVGPKAIRDGVVVEGYPTVNTDRGGGITWHGPGQLVAYPIIKWEVEEQGVRAIIGRLEDWAIDARAQCGIRAYKDTSMQGAWGDGHKIFSIGLSFLHWVSRHGMSINVSTPGTRVEDLEGCGMTAGVHTSLSQLGYKNDSNGRKMGLERMEEALIETCEKHLGRTPLEPVEWTQGMLA